MVRDIEKKSDQIVKALVESNQPKLIQRTLEKLQEYLKRKNATVQYAGELTVQQKDQIENAIRQRFDTVHEVSFVLNETLIGGVRIVFEDYVYDDSVLGRLSQLKGR
ncbi:F0F1 ATP synthase subunit delta [candidate division WWE3 bacterium]|nr:F0F1 ATP synthase subunit delta [candidate division WWE3 bacterium]